MADKKRKGIAAFFAPVPPAAKRLAATVDAVPAELPVPADSAPQAACTAEERRLLLNKRVALARRANAEAAATAAAAKAAGRVASLRSLLVDAEWGEALATEFASPRFAALEAVRFPPTLLDPLLSSPGWSRNSSWAESGPRRRFSLLSSTSSELCVQPHPRPCPARALTHAVCLQLNSCRLADVRVVVLGQDPYHGDGQACGLSFSVPPGVAVPSSLQNIHKELGTDLGLPRPQHGDLERWAAQGVLLLNATLTVRAHAANSHAKQGWEAFTDGIIRALLRRSGCGVVFLLWGKSAQEKAKLVLGGEARLASRHVVLEAPHPSGLSAHRGFFGCRHFSKANAALVAMGAEPIEWEL
jgi:uracil-DNA glycosylase